MATNPETDIEIEDDGDFTVTFSMTLPPEPADNNEQEKPRG